MLLVIYNALAGRGNVEKVIKCLCNDLIQSEIAFTTIQINQFSKTMAEELLCHTHVNRVIICGGDGTVNCAINKMDGYLKNIEIGIVPCGYGNLIAGSINASSSLEMFLSESSKTNFSEVKIGQANNQYFLNVASIGLTAETVSLVEKFRQSEFGSAFYRAFGGLIIHILFFCFSLIINKGFCSNNYPSSKAWIRNTDKRSSNSFLELSDISDMINKYKSLYLSGDSKLTWSNSNNSLVASKGDYIEHNYPFSWQIDGEPQEKTQSLEIKLNCQNIRILTIQQDWI